MYAPTYEDIFFHFALMIRRSFTTTNHKTYQGSRNARHPVCFLFNVQTLDIIKFLIRKEGLLPKEKFYFIGVNSKISGGRAQNGIAGATFTNFVDFFENGSKTQLNDFMVSIWSILFRFGSVVLEI